MGKLSNKILRKKAQEIYELYPDKITSDFEQNKKFLESLDVFQGKLSRNIIAGLLVKLSREKIL